MTTVTARESATKVAATIRSFMSRSLAPLQKRLDLIESRGQQMSRDTFWIEDALRRIVELEARGPDGSGGDNAHRLQRLSEHCARLETRLAKLERDSR